jgi:hypothetical protein
MEMKPSGTDPEMLRKRFIYGNVLLGLALLHQEESDKKSRQAKREKEGDDDDEEESEVNIEDRVEQFTRAIAPVLLPMIEQLGSLDLAELATADASEGDAT